jgi:hypothetical protein
VGAGLGGLFLVDGRAGFERLFRRFERENWGGKRTVGFRMSNKERVV